MAKIQISGEKPFSIVTNAFGVSHSSSGYTLNYSADGKEYTAYTESTPANETLLVCGLPANCFYKLVGNTDDVTITY